MDNINQTQNLEKIENFINNLNGVNGNQIIIIFGKEISEKTFDTKLNNNNNNNNNKLSDLIPLITSIFHRKPFLSKHNKLYHTKTYLETITKIKSLNSLYELSDNNESSYNNEIDDRIISHKQKSLSSYQIVNNNVLCKFNKITDLNLIRFPCCKNYNYTETYFQLEWFLSGDCSIIIENYQTYINLLLKINFTEETDIILNRKKIIFQNLNKFYKLSNYLFL